MVFKGSTITMLAIESEFFIVAQTPQARTRVGIGKSYLDALEKLILQPEIASS